MNNSNSGKPNIVIVGQVVIDHNKVEQTSYVRWGSPAMFMKRYFRSSIAVNPTIISSYGKDFLEFASETVLLPKKPNIEHTIVNENIVENGRRTQYSHGTNAKLPDITPEIIEALSKADLLYVAPMTPAFSHEYVSGFMRQVRPDCLKTLVPQGYLRTFDENGLISPRDFVEAAEIIPYFDLIVISDEEHPQADKVAHSWKLASPDTNIIVTRNIDGADIILTEGVQHIPTDPVMPDQIIDSTGLGDVFSSAAGYELQQTGDIEQAVKAGHLAAREKLLSPLVR